MRSCSHTTHKLFLIYSRAALFTVIRLNGDSLNLSVFGVTWKVLLVKVQNVRSNIRPIKYSLVLQ